MARKIVLSLGLILLLGGGFLWWRVTHPPLTDSEQIAANLEDIRVSLENNNIDRALGYLAEDAKFKGQSRAQIRSQLTLGSLMSRADVRVNFFNMRSDVKGATAATKGFYKVDERSRFGYNSHDGDFTLEWEKRDGQWIITKGDVSGDIPN